MRQMLNAQIVVGLLGFALLGALLSLNVAASFLCGVLLMTVNGWWLAARLEKGTAMDADSGQRSIYAGAALRFIALLAGLLLAYALGLHLLLVAVGMFVAQMVVFLLSLVWFRREKG